MVDFLEISTRRSKKGEVTEIYPKFVIPYKKSTDLMIRGGDFYAIWLADKGMWSSDEADLIQLIDNELYIYADEYKKKHDTPVQVLTLRDTDTGMIDKWHKYCTKQLRDSFHTLDEKIIFSNMKVKKTDYASRQLSYPLEEGPYDSYDRLMSVLYAPEERRKLEWAIGSIVSGDSKKIQKFIVLYGEPKSGKSTVLNIIEKLFDGYCSAFDARALGQANNAFALEAFKSNPLVAIQHDGDLSRIEDNTRLNSLVSHETMMINEKFKSAYPNKFKSFLFMGTNKPVKITDAKSGLIRRLIDVSPTGDRVTRKEYNQLMKQIDFELGAIAYHCLQVYEEDPNFYDNYIPTSMLGASNDFFNFMQDCFFHFKETDGITQREAWELYKKYCEDAKVNYPYPLRLFKEELRNYFDEFYERYYLEDGTRVRNYYRVLKLDKFTSDKKEGKNAKKEKCWLYFKDAASIFDDVGAEYPAQYASDDGIPLQTWSKVKTRLADLDSHKIHYVRVPENHIVIDFDIPNDKGEKCFEKNFEAASQWPPTYAELSKSGAGIHLHYIYDGDVSKLSRVYGDHIEVKIFTGRSSLRRKLTKCNDIPIATINSGLPLKGEKMIKTARIESEKGLRKQIKRNLNREIHPNTKPSIDFIKKILDDAYESGITYDVTDMLPALVSFAAESTHQADYCFKTVGEMQFKSRDADAENLDISSGVIVIYDVEVFPNLLIVNWKPLGNVPVVRMINPSSEDVEKVTHFKLVGFNCRKYDNHILYGRMLGYSNAELYDLSTRIIAGDKTAFFGDAYNLSYTDILDFSSEKKSLKKFEIELGIHHKELGFPWDQPVPKEKWVEVAEYCDNDVIATEAVWNARQSDFVAREILADIAGMTVNDTTNSLTTKIIFGKERNPQSSFNYRDMGVCTENDTPGGYIDQKMVVHQMDGIDKEYTRFDNQGRPVFPGYSFKFGKSTYRDVNEDNKNKDNRTVGEGGYVYAEPGMYTNVALLDIASMHPSSIIAENLFGPYTKNFKDLVDARIAIKHKDFKTAKTLLDGKLAKYLTDEKSAKTLSKALKIPINSVYGLTSASFENPFRDPRNVDNIVAKRGALFMINLRHEVQARGFTVAHIKTDSIKIPNATPEIIKFVMDYGSLYGYTFEHEATYERMCLVNNAVYIAKFASKEACEKMYGYSPEENAEEGGQWTATGTQFAVPYVFKTLFSHEPIEFKDLCETKQVTTSMYLDMCEQLPDVSEFEKELAKLKKTDNPDPERVKELTDEIAKGHNYIFIGRVGLFCPMIDGANGGRLVRTNVNKKTGEIGYSAVVGTKGYMWQESEVVANLGKQDMIDERYYRNLVDEAVDTISEFGDVEWFIHDVNDIPPWESAGEPWQDDGNAFAVR